MATFVVAIYLMSSMVRMALVGPREKTLDDEVNDNEVYDEKV
jgi:hypothetical protein